MRARFILPFIILVFLAGCQSPLVVPKLDGLQLTPQPQLSGCRELRWDASGERLAGICDNNTLKIFSPALNPLWSQPEVASFAWEPAGRRLALIGTETEASRMQLVAADTGSLLETVVLPEPPLSICWNRPGELLLLAYQVTHFRFGSNFKLDLYAWRDGQLELLGKLHDNTLKPRVWQQQGEQIRRGISLVSGPLGDLLLYSAYEAPPAFAGYFSLNLLDLDSMKSWRAVSELRSLGDFNFLPDHETLLVGDGWHNTYKVDAWDGAMKVLASLPGLQLAISPGGGELVIDQSWYHDGKLRYQLPAGSRLRFSPAGRQALLADAAGHWFLLEGLPAEKRQRLSPASVEKLRKLRRWRSLELIDAEEYQRLRKELP